MFKLQSGSLSLRGSRVRQAAFRFTYTLLAIEFLDELVFGVREAAWPLVRDDLRLSYVEIGLLLSLPDMFATFIEPVLGVLSDVWRRRAIILGGGVFFALAMLLTATSYSFITLLLAFLIFHPASGAFVALSQAALMDAEPLRREQNMARWALAGSLGNLFGPFALGLAVMLGVGWRGSFGALFVVALLLLVASWRLPFKTNAEHVEPNEKINFRDGLRGAFRALKNRDVVRWLILLEMADLMLDGLYGFLALYFVDVVGLTASSAGLTLLVWTCAGLPGDFLLIPLLERVRGLSYLRVSALVALVLFPLFLVVPGVMLKLVVLGALGFINAGWYSILQAQLYAAMPGRSGTVVALGSIVGVVSNFIPLALGLVAERFGLGAMMWLLILGPLALLLGIPRERK